MTAFAVLLTALVAGCGGGSSSSPSTGAVSSQQPSSTVSAASSSADNAAIATEGFNWFNLRRQQIGLAAVARNGLIDNAASGHSDYQMLNQTVSHEQVPGRPGFTGRTLQDRLTAAGYRFTQNSYSFGEVIAAATDRSGTNAAENLIGAIYHRFVIFEPMFREAGVGVANEDNGYTYFTANFAADGLSTGIGRGNLVTYPASNQQDVEPSVLSDRETPDPAPSQNEIGYPVSVHADIVSNVTVQSFTIRPRGGADLPTRLLSSATDAETPVSAAAILPLVVLAARTTYDVQFTGVVGGFPVSRAWSFTTR